MKEEESVEIEKTKKDTEKKIEELFRRDMKELSLKNCMDFVKQNKREPTDEELIKIFDNAGKHIAELWNKNPKNFQWVKNKPTKNSSI